MNIERTIDVFISLDAPIPTQELMEVENKLQKIFQGGIVKVSNFFTETTFIEVSNIGERTNAEIKRIVRMVITKDKH